MSLLLVGPSELSSTYVTGERFLSSVRPDVGGKVVRSGERPHANATLERFLAGVNANVAGEFVRARKSSIAMFYRTRIRTFMNWSLARPIGILARLDWHENQGASRLLTHLR